MIRKRLLLLFACVLGLLAACGSKPPESVIPTATVMEPTAVMKPELEFRLDEGIVRVNDAILRDAPGEAGERITVLSADTAVLLLAQTQDGNWYEVQLLDNSGRGWLLSDFVATVTPTIIATNTTTADAAAPTNTPLSEERVCERPSGWQTYTVLRGNTLFSIALATGTTVDELAAVNCLPNIDDIQAGQQLFVPHQPPTLPPPATPIPSDTPQPPPSTTPIPRFTSTPTPEAEQTMTPTLTSTPTIEATATEEG